MTSRPILVVDDDPSILDAVAEFLDIEGYDVQTATNGVEAMGRVELAEPSLVLLDMRMPVLDGWGFVRAMRESGRQLPIVVMTAAQDARKWAEEVDAAGFVSKPFDLEDLLDAVKRINESGKP